MMFAQKTLKCMGCKATLKAGQSTLCEHCKSREAEFYIERLHIVRCSLLGEALQQQPCTL